MNHHICINYISSSPNRRSPLTLKFNHSFVITIFVPEYKTLYVKPDTGKDHKKGVIYYKGLNPKLIYTITYIYDPYNWKLYKDLDQFNNSYFKSLKSEIWYLIIFVLLFRFYSNAPRVTERSAKKEFAAKSLFWKFKPTLKWIYKSISQFHPVFKSTHNSDKSMFSNPIYIKIGILI